MKRSAEKRLFWFLKEGAEIDLLKKAHLDMYVQQILTRGKVSDIQRLFKVLAFSNFKKSFKRIKNFLPWEVKKFWEEALGNINKSTEKNT